MWLRFSPFENNSYTKENLDINLNSLFEYFIQELIKYDEISTTKEKKDEVVFSLLENIKDEFIRIIQDLEDQDLNQVENYLNSRLVNTNIQKTLENPSDYLASFLLWKLDIEKTKKEIYERKNTIL